MVPICAPATSPVEQKQVEVHESRQFGIQYDALEQEYI